MSQVIHRERPIQRGVPALAARTVCAAFQLTAPAHADRVALRTPEDSVSLTFGEYAAQVRAIAAGLAALGVRRGDTVALMLVNRPEFNLVDMAALHLGAVPFSVYNTLIGPAVCIGDGRRYNTALLVLDPDAAAAHARAAGPADTSAGALAANPVVHKLVAAAAAVDAAEIEALYASEVPDPPDQTADRRPGSAKLTPSSSNRASNASTPSVPT